jgi:hypothetical protein
LSSNIIHRVICHFLAIFIKLKGEDSAKSGEKSKEKGEQKMAENLKGEKGKKRAAEKEKILLHFDVGISNSSSFLTFCDVGLGYWVRFLPLYLDHTFAC